MVNGHIQNISDGILIAEHHLQGLAVEAFAVAHIARDVHIRQELHFDTQLPLSLTGFTASAMHIERETPGLVSAHFAFGQFGVQLANFIKQTCVRSRVRAAASNCAMRNV